MNLITLSGCRSTPLLSYLQGLGVLRLLDEQHAPGLTSHWAGSLLHIEGNLDRESITEFFIKYYKPTPMLSPWNGGGGFRKAKCEKGEKAVQAIESSCDPRFAPLRTAIEAARQVWDWGIRAGWIDEKEKIDKKSKKSFLAACRAVFPDEALDWLDAAVVLADAKNPQYPLLLGTGGNFGRLDLTTNHLEALSFLLDPKRVERSSKLLAHALFGEGHPKLDNKPVGQFSPAAAGTMNSWAFGSAESVANLWSFVLGMEGALLFASGIARRFNGSQGLATTPFTVSSNPAGYPAAEGENVKGEFWAPLWGRPLTVPELRRIIAEGRISWGGRHAAHGVEAAKALGSLGVDRGLNRFERFVIAERFGQANLAVQAGSFLVEHRPVERVNLLGKVDGWLDRLRNARLPASAVSAIRRVDTAQIKVVQEDRPEPLQDLLVALSALEWIVSRNSDLQSRVRGPVPLLDPKLWGSALDDGSTEWRLAIAIATQHDKLPRQLSALEQHRGMASCFLRPVKLNSNPLQRKYLKWSDQTRGSEHLGSRGVEDRLCALLTSRALLCSDRQPAEEVPVIGSGVPIAFDHAAPVGLTDLVAFLEHRVEDQRLDRLISVASLLDRPSPRKRPKEDIDLISPARAVLSPFFHSRPLIIAGSEGEEQERLLLPTLSWPQKLRAGRVDSVMREAIIRLRAAGWRPGIRSEAIRVASPERLLSSLVIPVYTADVQRSLRIVCPPSIYEPTKEGKS